MRTASQRVIPQATETARTVVQQPEQSFGSILSDVSRLLWPAKTAAHVAALVGCSERAAEFYLAGHREWSGDAIAAIIAEVLKRHHMRNVRVVAKQRGWDR